MANLVGGILSLLVLTLAVRGNAQMCYFSRSCAGFSIPSSLNQCIATGLSHEDVTGVCTTFPVEFGFAQTTLIGDEQAEDYEIEFGFLQGRFDQVLQVTIDPIYHTARPSDIRLSRNRRTFAARSTDTDRVVLSLEIDSVAQEINEALTLRLNFDETLFDLPTDTLITELNVTIIDTESIQLRFSNDDYRATEGRNKEAPVTILKDRAIRLANPVTLRIIPQTVDQAIAQGIIDMDFPPEEGLSPLNILRSPIRANELDFNTTAFTVTLPSDEDVASPENELDVFVSIVDDELNERSDQYFVVTLEVIDAVNPTGVDIIQGVTRVIIGDNDDIRIGFARELYQYFEPISVVDETVIINLTLVKDDNRVSEQTFRIGITVNDPTIDVAAATLETDDTGPGEWDYRVGQVGQDFLLTDIFPLQQSLIVGFIMIGDNVPEGLEGFQLDASVETVGEFPQFALPLQSSTTAFRSTTVTIVDNDLAIVGWEQPSYTFDESDHFLEICVIVKSPTLTQNLPFEILLQYTPQSGTADVTDYFLLASPANLNFPISSPTDPPTNRTVCVNDHGFNLLLIDDAIGEATESFTLELSIRGMIEVNITPAITEIFILDDDVVTIGFIDGPYEANEADGVAFVRVGLIGATSLQRELSILLRFFAVGSALDGSDFSAPIVGQMLQFGPGNLNFDIPLTLVDDDVFELTETLQSSLSFPGGIAPPRVLINPGLVTVTVFDDDALAVQFDPNSYEVTEGGQASLRMVLNYAASVAVTVQWGTADNSATAGSDYTAVSGQTVTFPIGQTVQTVLVSTLDDSIFEQLESFGAVLSSPNGNGIGFVIGDQDTATVDITDNDLTVQFVPGTYSTTEGGQVAMMLQLIGAVNRAVTVTFDTTDGTATAGGNDYTDISSQLVTFPAGTTMQTVLVNTLDDSIFEQLETFRATLSSPDGNGLVFALASQDTATVDIIDNDLTVQFQPATYSAMEGEQVMLMLVLSGAVGRDVTVVLETADGSAIGGDGNDYMIISQTVTFTAGQTSLSVPVNILDDTLAEPLESFTTVLSSPDGDGLYFAIGAQEMATIDITDNDGAFTTDVPTPLRTTSPTTTSSHDRSDTSTDSPLIPSAKSPLDLTPTTSITNETTSGSTEEDDEPLSGSNDTIAYATATVIILLITILVLLLIIYLVRRKMRKQAATRQPDEEGDVKLQSMTATETSTGSEEHVYEPIDRGLPKKLEIGTTSQNEAYGINRGSTNKLEVDLTSPNEAYRIANWGKCNEGLGTD